MDLAAVTAVLEATMATENTHRKEAEKKLRDGSKNNPNEFVAHLCGVLSQGQTAELRQQAAVILRQSVAGDYSIDGLWDELTKETRTGLTSVLLASLQQDSAAPVRRSAGHVIVDVVKVLGDNFEEINNLWPELMPCLFSLIGGAHEVAVRANGLFLLKELASDIGEGLLKHEQARKMLEVTLSDTAPEIRAGAAQLCFAFVENLESEDIEPIGAAMPTITTVLRGFAQDRRESELSECLKILSSAAEADGDFFRKYAFKQLWEFLMEMCATDAGMFEEQDARHNAMECAMAIVVSTADNEEPDGFLPTEAEILEQVTKANLKWMTELHDSLDEWTKIDSQDDEIDPDSVGFAESNFDSLAEDLDEDTFMPVLFKIIREPIAAPDTNWKHLHASIVSVSQVVEHLEDEDWVFQCCDFVNQFFKHPHARVRHAAFMATAQIAYDHAQEVQYKYGEPLMKAVLEGMTDENVRVVAGAVYALTSLSDEMDSEDIEPFLEEVLKGLFVQMGQTESRELQENCICALYNVAEAAESSFTPYYETAMPLLKQVITTATGEKQRTVRGKALQCVGVLGGIVGKEAFLKDANDAMGVMMPMFQAGFAADDTIRTDVHAAAGKIAEILGKDFKPYASSLLSTVSAILMEAPRELSPDDDEDDMSLTVRGDTVVGLKTSVMEEMDEALELIICLMKSLEEDFCDFLQSTTSVLLQMAGYSLTDDVSETLNKAWIELIGSAQSAVVAQKLEPAKLRECMCEYLKKTVGEMRSTKEEELATTGSGACVRLVGQCSGVAGVIEKGGEGVLPPDVAQDIANVVCGLIAKIVCPEGCSAESHRFKVLEDKEEEDSDEDEDASDISPQSVRYGLASIMCALLRTCPGEFAKSALAEYMQFVSKLVQPESSECDRSLGFSIADDVIHVFGDQSVTHWGMFMNYALNATLDKSPIVQRYATKVIGDAAKCAAFKVMSGAAVTNLYQVLQKHGEKHRRRRVKKEQMSNAFAIDASIRSLGQILVLHQDQLGTHAAMAWKMWINNLPMKYDMEAGQLSHAQLLELLGNEHAAIVDPEQLPKVLQVLTDVWKTKFSTQQLDQHISFAFNKIGSEKLDGFCADFKEAQKNKLNQIVKVAPAA